MLMLLMIQLKKVVIKGPKKIRLTAIINCFEKNTVRIHQCSFHYMSINVHFKLFQEP